MNFYCIVCIACLAFVATPAFAQADKSTRPSPPVEIKGTLKGANVILKYSAPSVKGRTIWGDLVPYGKVWRTGANEATTFETDMEISIQGQKLPAGNYALFTVPGETEWTWIFNSVWDQWGSFKYDDSKDVIRIKAIPQGSPVFHEQMLFEISENGVVLSWANLSVGLEVK